MLGTVKSNHRRIPFFFPELEQLTNPVFNETGTAKAFRPAANINEYENHYAVLIAAPGFQKEDFSLKVEKDLLTISAKKEQEKTENEKVIRQEFNFQNFVRTFHLTEKIDSTQISASYEAGILKVSLNKKPEIKPEIHTISVS
jgi:HSP20 family protein